MRKALSSGSPSGPTLKTNPLSPRKGCVGGLFKVGSHLRAKVFFEGQILRKPQRLFANSGPSIHHSFYFYVNP